MTDDFTRESLDALALLRAARAAVQYDDAVVHADLEIGWKHQQVRVHALAYPLSVFLVQRTVLGGTRVRLAGPWPVEA